MHVARELGLPDDDAWDLYYGEVLNLLENFAGVHPR
jgi:hypothetical protein